MKYYNFVEAFNTPLLNKEGGYQKSDKNDFHKYGILYDYIINAQYLKNQSPLSILEVGIRQGDSIKIWENSPLFDRVVGIDMDPQENNTVKFEFSSKVTLEQGMDAYDPEVVKYISDKYPKFDIILDDGDHMWESQMKFFQYYFNLLNPGGVIMCEDITRIYLPQLTELAKKYTDSFYTFDLTANVNPKNCHGNDIVAVIKNS